MVLTVSDYELAKIAAACDGFVLPGSPADVTTELYGQDRGEFTADPDSRRERVDRALLEQAWASGKPLLGICFGMQMMNVWRGGTLLQDLTPMPVNHSAGRSVLLAHRIGLDAASNLAAILRLGDRSVEGIQHSMVNSSHHQAVAIAGNGLRIVARSAEDQVVEAIERVGDAGFFIGVQWHPERSFHSCAASRLLFEAAISSAKIISPSSVART